jgi:hypothetical protein
MLQALQRVFRSRMEMTEAAAPGGERSGLAGLAMSDGGGFGPWSGGMIVLRVLGAPLPGSRRVRGSPETVFIPFKSAPISVTIHPDK